jgi:hypothetical protein
MTYAVARARAASGRRSNYMVLKIALLAECRAMYGRVGRAILFFIFIAAIGIGRQF